MNSNVPIYYQHLDVLALLIISSFFFFPLEGHWYTSVCAILIFAKK